ncbi:MAG: hypothetical protein LBS97_03695 [Treponema sp.]|nr:hypothetical protein [Treponema sp.]
MFKIPEKQFGEDRRIKPDASPKEYIAACLAAQTLGNKIITPSGFGDTFKKNVITELSRQAVGKDGPLFTQTGQPLQNVYAFAALASSSYKMARTQISLLENAKDAAQKSPGINLPGPDFGM